jgi:hypothetical protein
MGRARLAVKRSPSLAVLVESSLAVKIVIRAPERIVKTRGGVGAGAAALEPAAAPGFEVASGVGEADVRAVATLGEGVGPAVAAFSELLDEQPSCANSNATKANPQTV